MNRLFLTFFSLVLCSGIISCSSGPISRDIPGPVGLITSPDTTDADVIVYGGTASGAIAAYTVALNQKHVILLEPGTHLGGMVTGGLSSTDVTFPAAIGGYTRYFFQRVAHLYGKDLSDTDGTTWRAEPHLDQQILDTMMEESGAAIHYNARLVEKKGVTRNGTHITSIKTQDGKVWTAKVFIDCSYEGELMAQSGVHYVVSRESSREYGESLAGVHRAWGQWDFAWHISAYDDQGNLLPEVFPGPMGAVGAADKNIQAYNFRVTVTSDPANQIPFPQPSGYNANRFALLKLYLAGYQAHYNRPPKLGDIMDVIVIPGTRKADINGGGAFSTDYVGHSWEYPDATYARKKEIWAEHLNYVQSLLYFVANDPSVPADIQNELRKWGLPKDEFASTGHWPDQLYIREGRRMIGAYVMRQSDVQTDLTKEDSVGLAFYQVDIHGANRLVMRDGSVANEGVVMMPPPTRTPYEIPYRMLTPKPEEADNLLVPVCASATHVAYSSYRMEPHYMVAGQAAGDAAVLAVQGNTTVQKVSISALQQLLLNQEAYLHYQ